MTYVPNSNFELQVLLGQVPGMSMLTKFGFNSAVDATGGGPYVWGYAGGTDNFEDVWNGGSWYTGQDASSADTVDLVSSSANDTGAGAGARTVQLYGLDANYDAISETLTLTGTTPVTSTKSYLRLNRLIIRTVGATGYNVGTITADDTATSTNVFAVMPEGFNQTMIAAWTVPAGKTAYLRAISIAAHGNATADLVFRLMVRPKDECFQVKEEWGLRLASTTTIQRSYPIWKGPYTEKSDIKMAVATDVNGTPVWAAFDMIIVDNETYGL